MDELGVGVVFQDSLAELLASRPDLAAVVEVEPQTLWRATGDAERPFNTRVGTLQWIATLPQAKLVHSVGMPVGGTIRPDGAQVDALNQTIGMLSARWASEHLAFNRAPREDGSFPTGFLLPPRQTDEGVEIATANIGALARALPVPFAVETGVNYLRRRRDEMTDGAFIRAVVERADCGILLDLHNVWANERNGRQTIEEFLSELPIERVVEVHLAGGFELDGFWLDAHSGLVPDPLLERAARIVPHLPSLGAIVFEILGPFIDRIGLDRIAVQLEALWKLWDRRRTRRAPAPRRASASLEASPLSPAAWEHALGSLVVGRRASAGPVDGLESDPAIAIFRRLVWQVRAGMIVDNLRLTCRLILLEQGESALRSLFDRFFATKPPSLTGADEARAFAGFLEGREPAIRWIADILALERGALEVATNGRPLTISLRIDPSRLVAALSEGTVPHASEESACIAELVPEEHFGRGLATSP